MIVEVVRLDPPIMDILVPVEGESDDHESPLLVLFLELDESRYFSPTRNAPRGPEVDDDHLVFEIRGGDGRSVRPDQAPVRALAEVLLLAVRQRAARQGTPCRHRQEEASQGMTSRSNPRYFFVQQAWGSPAAAFLQQSGICAMSSSVFLQQSAFFEGSAFEALQHSERGAPGCKEGAQHLGTWALRSAVFWQQAAIGVAAGEEGLLQAAANIKDTAVSVHRAKSLINQSPLKTRELYRRLSPIGSVILQS